MCVSNTITANPKSFLCTSFKENLEREDFRISTSVYEQPYTLYKACNLFISNTVPNKNYTLFVII